MQAAADPMSFPPGLLPALVKEHLRTEENYEPLSRKDVERAGIPPVKPADSYLLARLDKFYAELQVWARESRKCSGSMMPWRRRFRKFLLIWPSDEDIHV